MNGCGGCGGWKRRDQFACNECNGVNDRKSYRERTGNLATCVVAAAVEELRYRRTAHRIATHSEPT